MVEQCSAAHAEGRGAIDVAFCPLLSGRRVTAWTTLLELVRTWLRREPPDSGRLPSILPTEQRAACIASEYRSLYTYLEHRYASVVVLTFEQVEALLGSALPSAATTDRGWWTDATVRANRYSEAWVGAGRTATPNLSARTVTFERLP